MAKTERNYKDTLFRMVFREKQELLSLYNALNGTAYDNPEELEINTLENAVYMDTKAIAELLELDEEYVAKAADFICQHTNDSDLDIAVKMATAL